MAPGACWFVDGLKIEPVDQGRSHHFGGGLLIFKASFKTQNDALHHLKFKAVEFPGIGERKLFFRGILSAVFFQEIRERLFCQFCNRLVKVNAQVFDCA